MGLTRVELVTSRLSGVRSNHLSYRPRTIVNWEWRIHNSQSVEKNIVCITKTYNPAELLQVVPVPP